MELKSKFVTVTGGCGFIGRHIVRELQRHGAEVTVLDDRSSGHSVPEGIKLVEGDVRSGRDAERAIPDGTDYVIHAAVRCVRMSESDPHGVFTTNANGTLTVGLRAAEIGARFVYMSSSEVYGNLSGKGPMTEGHRTYPNTVYGAGKLAGEAIVKSLNRQKLMPTCIIRPFNAYGPESHIEGIKGEIIPRWISAAIEHRPFVVHGSIESAKVRTRDFTFVTDTAKGVVAVLLCKMFPSEQTFNLCSGSEISLYELGKLIARLCNVEPNFRFSSARPGETERLRGDNSSAKVCLQWEPTIALEEGLQTTIAWIKTRGFSYEQVVDEPWILKESK